MSAVDAIAAGRSFPLGATVTADGVNFSVFAKLCDRVELLLFEAIDSGEPAQVIELDPGRHRTDHYWHALVPGAGPGQPYGYRVHGPFAPHQGLRFDGTKLLLDPYARAIAAPPGRSRDAAAAPGGNLATALRAVVASPAGYDWEGDRAPRIPFAKTVVYELHVGNFTRHPSSGVAPVRRGTYAGLIDKIPYLVDLGVTAVELMPVFAFDEQEAPGGLRNVWGYQPLGFFAPHPGYSSSDVPLGVLDEFRDMVKALHRAGLEVILDVVYNHSAEGDGDGPMLGFRGFANETYYILGPDKATYPDYTGCGNSLNVSDTVVRRMILDSLHYWVAEMHVDGFRFDLASVLLRDQDGQRSAYPPTLLDIASDPVLASVKLIAEAWDAGGLYDLGRFSGDRWKEWNGQFRDDVRAFVKGDPGRAKAVACRLIGSPDLFAARAREPEQSVNFVTCHDGFTVNDLVSFNDKHNEPNGQDNRDGADNNLSWNGGIEGPTTDPAIERLRNQQVKNLLALTLLATGTPMLSMGDEVRRTQRGNNNAWCLDDETTWLDWSGIASHSDVYRFVKALIACRRAWTLPVDEPGLTLNELLARSAIEWHGVALGAPDWSTDSHSFAVTARSAAGPLHVHLIVNAFWQPLAFALPRTADPSSPWRRCIDTARESPADILPWRDAESISAGLLAVAPRSLVLLVAGRAPRAADSAVAH